MIPVPPSVLDAFAGLVNVSTQQLIKFAGGKHESDGVIYSYPYENRHRLLKIMEMPIDQQRIGLLCLHERLKFMKFLSDNGAAIAFPLLTRRGELFDSLTSNDHVWIGYSMEIAPGQAIRAESWDTDFFQNWGRTIGFLHRLAGKYPTWDGTTDPLTGEKLLTWRGEWHSFYNWCKDDDVKEKWSELKTCLERLPVNREIFGFTHNDPHIWNLLAAGERLTVLDFDVANHHWFINDIAIACQSILIFHSGGLNRPLTDRKKLLNFLQYFMRGYTQEHRLPDEWINWLDTFIAYRRILHFIVSYDWLKTKPKRLKTIKDMILSSAEVVGTFH